MKVQSCVLFRKIRRCMRKKILLTFSVEEHVCIHLKQNLYGLWH